MKEFDFPPKLFMSNALNRFFSKLDAEIFDLEETVESLLKENKKLHSEIMDLTNKNYEAIQSGMANIFKSFFPEEAVVTDATTAVILRNILDLNDLDKIKSYIIQIFDNSKQEIAQKKNLTQEVQQHEK